MQNSRVKPSIPGDLFLFIPFNALVNSSIDISLSQFCLSISFILFLSKFKFLLLLHYIYFFSLVYNLK